MKSSKRIYLFVSLILLVLFVFWTVAVRFTDVQAIGPEGSKVGFASMNGAFHDLTGVHMALYTVTDWLGIVPFCFVLGFAILGLVQLIKRKSLFKVDRSLLVLGGFYIIVLAVYVLFEFVSLNFRPILIDGRLEASYPSSTTMLALCVIPTAMMQFNGRIKNKPLRAVVLCALGVFALFMTVGRTVSGVHWLSDIIGGAIISASLVIGYYAVNALLEEKGK